jgi:hypothetical protein
VGFVGDESKRPTSVLVYSAAVILSSLVSNFVVRKERLVDTFQNKFELLTTNFVITIRI